MTSHVFADLGFNEEEAALSLEIRADLMIALARLIEARDLTQSAARWHDATACGSSA